MGDNQIEEVKLKTDIVSIIGERIELKKAGRNFKANCPFHGEKTPSFMVSPELQIFKCFGCDAKGDVFNFLDQYEGMEFSEALKYLAEKAGVKLKNFKSGAPSDKEKVIEINTQTLRFYNYLLLNHPAGKKALEYLEKNRGLNKKTIEEFQLGYSPENSYAINNFLIGKKKFTPTEIEKAGIGVVRGGGFYDRFNGRVIFPLFDHRGNPIGFAGRILPWDKRDTGKYINSPETPVYHKSNVLFGLNLTRGFIKKKKIAIIVEGELDLISSWQSGIKNVVAIKGSALTEEQVRLLSRFAEKFILSLDSDMAGDAAARRGLTIAANLGIEVKVAKITGYKDPDEAARGNIESYKNDLIKAVGVWDFLIDSVISRFGATSGANKAKISKEIIPILSEINDKIVQAHYANIVARKLNVPLEAVNAELNKKEVPVNTVSLPSKPIEEKGRKELLEERLLTIAFQADPKILSSEKILDLITTPLYKKILTEFRSLSQDKDFNISDFGNKLPAELFESFSKMMLATEEILTEKQDDINRELELIQKELKILSVREKLKELAFQIHGLEEKGEEAALNKIQTEFKKLTKTLSDFESED